MWAIWLKDGRQPSLTTWNTGEGIPQRVWDLASFWIVCQINVTIWTIWYCAFYLLNAFTLNRFNIHAAVITLMNWCDPILLFKATLVGWRVMHFNMTSHKPDHFIGPESDHWQCLSVTHWLTHSLPFSGLMLNRNSEIIIGSRFVNFQLMIWTQPSGPLCLWQLLK